MLTTTGDLKLFNHLYEKISRRELRTFSALVDYVESLKLPARPDAVFEQCFALIKELNWGFLRDLDRSEYTRLWKELVIPHSKFPTAGDLKRNISISNIYIAMLDIHGYTRFCQESKANLSRLRKLDEFLHEGIRRIARSHHALANRERGDEIVVIAPTATDCLQTTLAIINAFSQHAVIKGQSMSRNQAGYSIVLPDFKVTAGIAGGNLTTPLIITESGLLSGFLLNTAARLQSLANEFSPKDSKVMITNSVYANFVKENRVVRSELVTRKLVNFFNLGPVSFKGTKVVCYEVLFGEGDKHRLRYAPALGALFESVRQELWKGRIVTDLLYLVEQVAQVTPAFSAEARIDGETRTLTNADIAAFCRQARELANQEDYTASVRVLGSLRAGVSQIPEFDRLVVRYVEEIHERLERLSGELERRLAAAIEEKLDVIFSPQYKDAYLNARKCLDTYDKLQAYALKSKVLGNRKSVWYSLIEDNKEALRLEIYSGKR
jgi:class 3 adenylate cyclase